MSDLTSADSPAGGGIFIPASAVAEANRTGKPVVIDHPEAIALAEAGVRGIPTKRETPATVGIIGGQTNTEINPRLSMGDWFGSYGEIGWRDRIRREWTTGQSIDHTWRLAVLEREWRFSPPKGGDRNDLLVAEFMDTAVRHHFRGGSGGYMGLIGMFAGLAWDGFVAAQPYYPEDKSFTLKDDTGKVVLQGAHMLQLAPVGAHVIDKWVPEVGKHGAICYGLDLYEQTTDGASGWHGRSRHLDASQIVHARYMPQGDDPAPYGIGRSLWYGYKASESIQKFLLQGAEKASFGIPQVVVGPNANPAELDNVNALISNLRVGAMVRFSLPDGYSVQWHEVPWRAADLLSALEHIDKAAHRATNTQHAFTGSDNGTQALHGSQSDEFHGGVDVVCRTIVQALHEGPVDTSPLKRLAAYNFAGLTSFPELTFGPPPVRDSKEFADAIRTGVDGGFLTPDAGVEARFRDALHLDEMPEETRARWEFQLQNESPPEIGKPADGDEDDVDPPPEKAPAAPEADEGGEEGAKAEDAAKPVAASDVYERSRYDRIESGPRGRAVRPMETVISLADTKGQQDAGKEALAGVLVRWRQKTAEAYGAVLEKSARSLGDVATLPVPGQAELKVEIKRVLRQVYRGGIASVEGETERLTADPSLLREMESGELEAGKDIPAPSRIVAACDCGAHLPMLDGRRLRQRLVGVKALADKPGVRKAKKPKPAPSLPDSDFDEIDPEDAIEAIARTTTVGMAQRLRQSAMASLQSQGKNGMLPAAVADVVTTSILSLSDGAERNQAQGDTNDVFGLGRAHEQRAQGSERFMFSNLLESRTCEQCEQWDGHVFGADEYEFFATPFSACEGGNKCGCLVLGWPPDLEAP